ncbi:metallophosphoesterase family protein [Halorubrum cibi]|uniref:metallophosphoesterase family protein n=1 Tax=Halorubrum cibi TaxID=413815 RepID=UPI001FE49C2D|nr:metallophosphoesterase [Halorubrum cibi]
MTELYDSLAVLYRSLPSEADSEWQEAVKSVLYGGELLADEASCYGAQQKDRNLGKRKEYARRHGNGKRVTEFSAITVAEPRKFDCRYVPSGAKLPIAPESGDVLPVKVTTEEVDQAIALLAELPAEPTADRSDAGADVLLDPARVRQARQTASQSTGDEETTVLFVSDTHLGYENRAETGSGKTVSWIDEISSRETIHRIRTIAIEQDVDAVLHTGDVLDHEVDAVTLDAAASSLDVLSQLGIPVYCIIGTHDHNAANPQHSESVDGVAWLKEQVSDGNLIELDTTPTAVAGGSLDAYGVSAENVGIDDVETYNSLGWRPSGIAFGAASPGPNVLCLHEGMTPYRSQSVADIDLDELVAESRVSFDCVLVGDEHRPKHDDFENGYTFETQDGTPVLYTGPAVRVSWPYRDRDAFVTVLTISDSGITTTRHTV